MDAIAVLNPSQENEKLGGGRQRDAADDGEQREVHRPRVDGAGDEEGAGGEDGLGVLMVCVRLTATAAKETLVRQCPNA